MSRYCYCLVTIEFFFPFFPLYLRVNLFCIQIHDTLLYHDSLSFYISTYNTVRIVINIYDEENVQKKQNILIHILPPPPTGKKREKEKL